MNREKLEHIAMRLRHVAHTIRRHPETWTQGDVAQDRFGMGVGRVDHPDACRWCAAGYVELAVGSGPEYDFVEDLMSKWVAPLSLPGFNDERDRLPQDIADLFQEVAQEIEQQATLVS